jgi:hypothetical protein
MSIPAIPFHYIDWCTLADFDTALTRDDLYKIAEQWVMDYHNLPARALIEKYKIDVSKSWGESLLANLMLKFAKEYKEHL